MEKSKLYLVTIATENKFYMNYLISSIKKYDMELKILGYGMKWQGYNWRNKLVLDFINNLNPNDIICCIDGYDVICIRDPDEMINEFNKIKSRENCKIIAGCEYHQSTFNYVTSKLFFGNCKGQSVCAGTYIAQVKDLKNIIGNILEMNQDNNSDDQVLLTKYCYLNPTNIYIDVNSELFLTLSNSSNQLDITNYLDSSNNIVVNGNKPFFLHAPGNTCIDNVLKKLGYVVENEICKDIISNIPNKNSHYINEVINNFFIHFVILLLIIILVIKYHYKI